MAPECIRVNKRLAEKIAGKRREPHASVITKDKAQVCLVEEHNLGQLSRQLLQPPVGSNTDVGETQTRYQSVATLNGLKQY